MKSDIELGKKIYGYKGALEILDEEFIEFALKGTSVQEFFESYYRFFYNFQNATHQHFYANSLPLAYPDGYENPRLEEIRLLNKQISDIIRAINSVERHHFFFKNNIFTMDDIYEEDPTPQITANTAHVFYIQSARKRKITDYQTYLNLKTRQTKHIGEVEDTDFINFLSADGLAGLPSGPDIVTLDDIFMSIEEINIWPLTLDTAYRGTGVGHEEPIPESKIR